MNNIISLFRGVFTFIKTIKKSMYRNCAIIAAGTTVIAIFSFSSTCYGGGGKNVAVAFAAECSDRELEDSQDEDTEKEEVLFAKTEEFSFPAPRFADLIKFDIDKRRSDVEADLSEEDVKASADYITPIITITEEDYNNLVRIVEAEATGLDVKAKILVANVVINRVFSKDFPNDVTSVIFQGDGEQFQPIKDGRFYSVGLTDTSYEAVDRALLGEDYSEGALFFASTASAGPNSWFATHLIRLFDYNGHVFFNY